MKKMGIELILLVVAAILLGCVAPKADLIYTGVYTIKTVRKTHTFSPETSRPAWSRKRPQ